MGLFEKQSVAFTGRCVALSRAAAEAIVVREGGEVTKNVSDRTSLLVVGSMGWPLQRSGRLTRKLDDARRLQRSGAPLVVEGEREFLRRLGRDLHSAVHRVTLAEMASLVSAPPQRLLYWVSTGLVTPVEVRDEIAFFSFSEVARCTALAQLASAGINGGRLLRSLQQLQVWLPETAAILDRLAPDGRRLSVRDNAGRRIEPRGQYLIDFGDSDSADISYPGDAEWLFAEAVECEQAGNFAEAEAAYRRLLERDGHDVDVLYNLANLLVEQGRREEAVHLYEAAVGRDAEFVEGWTNLGAAQLELGKFQDALRAYQRACDLDRQYPAALFGLAKAFDACGYRGEARWRWQDFLQQQPTGDWADYARGRLDRLTGD
jgi:hypothetical protein